MKILVGKMSKLGFLKLEIILGTIWMAIAMIGVPVGIIYYDASLFKEPMVLGVTLIGMLMFASVGFICFIRPYLIYRKFPMVQAETDGEFLYIHTKKEAKIPLASLANATVRIELPFLFQKEFISELIVHMFSDKYGDIVLKVPGYGTYRMRFISQVYTTGEDFSRFIDEIANNA